MANIHILVTNDDGIFAPGIKALVAALKTIGTVEVVAPETEKSAVSHAITISSPLRATKVDIDGAFFGHAVNGTPADCIKLGVRQLVKKEPDIVVSGINLGSNTASNVIYSGTAAGAAEAALLGIPALAVSLTSFSSQNFSYAAKVARHMVLQTIKNGLPERTILNINVPAIEENEVVDVMATKQGRGMYGEVFEERVDPKNKTYYWMGGKRMVLDKEMDIDDVAVMHNNVAITPIQYDLTHHNFLKELQKWKLKP